MLLRMRQYLELVERVLTKGKPKGDRTGTGTIAIFGAEFRHDMKEGFPLLTTKKMHHIAIRVELEGFINGVTDKRWYQERGCRIWDEWCNPRKVPYRHDEETKAKMREERDLGPIYGYQWRYFNSSGRDQLREVIREIKENPNSRRVLVSAWNPLQLGEMALVPCHYSFCLNIIDNKLNLAWDQRSVDTMLGLPFNIASYGLLLNLIAKETGYEEGELVGHLKDVHIYKNHIEKAKEQLEREPYALSEVKTSNFLSVFHWNHQDTEFINYQSHPKIEFPIAV